MPLNKMIGCCCFHEKLTKEGEKESVCVRGGGKMNTNGKKSNGNVKHKNSNKVNKITNFTFREFCFFSPVVYTKIPSSSNPYAFIAADKIFLQCL